MNKQGKILTAFGIRIVGAIGFFLLAYQYSVFGTTLIGIEKFA